MINAEGQYIPDPRFSNPEFFDFSNSDSPIVQYANAFEIKPEEVSAGLSATIETPIETPAFAVIRTSDGVALMMATQNAEGKWQWFEATTGNYWRAYNKDIGVYVNTEQLNDPVSQEIIERYFANGSVAWGGDISNVSNASKLQKEARSLICSYLGIAVAEPGKFPEDVNVINVDAWLDQKLDDAAHSVEGNKIVGRPTYINFNEAWGETQGWNLEFNPLRDKYGDNNWVGEYIYKVISRFIGKGLLPNEDFVILFNDARLYNRPDKQDFIFNSLLKARQDAFDKLTADPIMKQKINEMGIKSPEDIQIILGSETHTKLGSNEDNVDFWLAPTDEELRNLAEKFAPLGGVLMTEVNPFGSSEQKSEFLKQLVKSIELPGFRGILFWNVLRNSDVGNPEYPLVADPLVLFDEGGSPAPVYYELLR